MPHLVEPIRPESDEEISIKDCLTWVTESRDFLVGRGRESLVKASRLAADSQWGALVKREIVDISGNRVPRLIGKKLKTQTITEVINQTANMARLIDLLSWIVEERPDLSMGTVKACHPTTSSGPLHGTRENDLSLTMSNGAEAHFEISDVSGDIDGNNKEFKSLVSLRCLPKGITKEKALSGSPLPWPNGKMFIAISVELADVICQKKRWWRSPPINRLQYQGPFISGDTRIFEVLEA